MILIYLTVPLLFFVYSPEKRTDNSEEKKLALSKSEADEKKKG